METRRASRREVDFDRCLRVHSARLALSGCSFLFNAAVLSLIGWAAAQLHADLLQLIRPLLEIAAALNLAELLRAN
ncbi:hypothetical protein Dimus_015587, partial [Dionaea muscipula]